jgi:cytochrome c oxidase assembly factor CtaG
VWAVRTPAARFLGHPLVGFVGYALVIPMSHLTSFYNLTLENEQIHDAEHLLFLVFGYLFWRQVFGIEPNEHRLHPALQMGYLFLAVPVDTFTGLSLNSTTTELFPAYRAMHRTWGPSLVTDLHIGGVIMWVVGDSLMLLAMIPVAVKWLHYEERRSVRVDRELDRLLPGPSDRGRDHDHHTGNGAGNGVGHDADPSRPAPGPASVSRTPTARPGWRGLLPPSRAGPAAPPG